MVQYLLPLVEAKGDDLAIVDEVGSVTWTELNVRVNRMIRALQGLGLEQGDAEHAELAAAALEQVPAVEHRIVFGGVELDGFLDLEELIAAHDPDEPEGQTSGATMFYTSGTTGRPKGVRSTLMPIGEDPAVVQLLLEGLGTIMRFPATDAAW